MQTITKTLDLVYGNTANYFSGNLDKDYDNAAFHINGTSSYVYDTANSSAKNKLYPNATAHPTSASAKTTIRRTSGILGSQNARWTLLFNGTAVWEAKNESTSFAEYSSGQLTDSVILNSLKNTSLQIGLRISNGIYEEYCRQCSITLSFSEYSFSAVTSTGIASVTCKNTTSDSDGYNQQIGYNGDTIQYSATVQSGYEFAGWYNGDALVSTSLTYNYTVNGEDLTLTAKSIRRSSKLIATYNGSQVISKDITSDTATVTYNGIDTVITNGNSKTFKCKNRKARTNILVEGSTMKCKDKVMKTDVIISLGGVLTNLLKLAFTPKLQGGVC